VSLGRARSALLVLLAIAAPPAGSAGPAPAAPAVAPPAEAPASLADRLAWNPWERTRAGIRRLEKGDAAGAASALDTALRLRAGDPRAAFNAGTGRLAAGRPDAVAPLEQAARSAEGDLAPDAWYNLGNARLAAGNARGAVDAYVETLRRASGREDAKRNLELALRELERQRERQRADPREQQDRPQNDSARRDGNGSPDSQQRRESGAQQPPPPSPSNDSASRAGQQPGPSPRPQPETGAPETAGAAGASTAEGRSRLPDFRDQPDLDAEQAAALLQAVENLERQQRRERALERARQRRSEDEDW
jgi:tetratricopeptide (TPR) repeat protein